MSSAFTHAIFVLSVWLFMPNTHLKPVRTKSWTRIIQPLCSASQIPSITCSTHDPCYKTCNLPLSLGPWLSHWAVVVLCMCPANERRRYIVTSSLIGCAHTQCDSCIEAKTKWQPFLRIIFSNSFSCMKNCYILYKTSLKFVCKCPVNNNPALVQIMTWPNRWQAIIWTNDSLVYWWIYSSFGLSELIVHSSWHFIFPYHQQHSIFMYFHTLSKCKSYEWFSHVFRWVPENIYEIVL